MSSPTNANDSNANATSPSRRDLNPRLTNSPPTGPVPNAPPISSSDNANSIDVAATMDPNIRDNAVASSSGSSGIDGVEQMSGEAPAPPVAMAEAANVIVAKQRRGEPGVEQDGIHDAAPTPYAEAPDIEDEAGKSLGSTSKNHHVYHDVKDDGARPFDSGEFEDGGVGKKIMTRGGDDPNDTQIIEEGTEGEEEMDNEQEQDNAQDINEEVEVNAGRPQHQVVMLPTRGPPRSMLPNDNDEESMIELEATLVPNEPVYDGVPLEPVPVWYRQEKARPFFAFICIMFVATVVGFSVLFPKLSGSSIPEDSSLSTEIVTVMPLESTAPSTTLSTVPLISFAPSMPPSISFTPSTPPSKTSNPSNLPSSSFLPSSSPTNTCFDSKDELVSAFRSYIDQNCAQNENCNTAGLYGYPMKSWCVGKITSMSYLFSDMRIFNEDISEWDVSSVRDMRYMFKDASAFNGDLSAWNVSSVTNMNYMFTDARAFNGDLSAWNVSSVTDMRYMFYDASVFNGDLSPWDISSVKNMKGVFGYASAFNSDLSQWNVSSVTDMKSMFNYASAFNGDLSAWNVSSVTDMGFMFWDASTFNGDLSAWDISSVTNMEWMFRYASAFNGDLSAWNVTSVADMEYMFWGASAFNQDLCAWNDKFPYNHSHAIFSESGCTFQYDPNEQQGGPFCASSCNE